MNNIIPFLGLEDTSVMIEDISTEGHVRTITLSTPPDVRFCPRCGFRMHSRGIRTRKINHPIMQDTFQVVILLKQRRWRCTNELCRREENETFSFIGKRRRNTNASDFLIVNAFRNLITIVVSNINGTLEYIALDNLVAVMTGTIYYDLLRRQTKGTRAIGIVDDHGDPICCTQYLYCRKKHNKPDTKGIKKLLIDYFSNYTAKEQDVL